MLSDKIVLEIVRLPIAFCNPWDYTISIETTQTEIEMLTSIVPETIYQGAGWAVAALAGDTVIAAIYIEHPDADLKGQIEQLKASQVVIAAGREADEAYDAIEAAEASDADEEEIDRLNAIFEAKALKIRGGMMSATEFCHTFDAKERAKAGISNKWF